MKRAIHTVSTLLRLVARAIRATLVLAVALSTAAAAQVPITAPLHTPGAEHPADVTITVTPAPDSDARPVSFSGMRLHGVAWFDRIDKGPRLTFGADGQALPIRFLESAFGRRATWSATVTPTGRPLEDLCTPPADPTIDAAPSINWCLRLSGSIRLGKDVYGIVGPILLPDGGVMEGAGGAVLGPVLADEYGTTYQPVIPADERTTLRVLDGEAFTFAQPDSVLSDIQYARRVLRQERTTTFLASRATRATVRHIEFDGNATAEGLASVDRPTAESCLRNGPCHTALAFGRHGGLVVPGEPGEPGRFVTLEGLYIHDWAATSILGDQNAVFTGSTILLKNALYNHLLYGAEGEWTDLTISGFAWTHAILTGQGRGGSANTPSTYRNLVVHELTENPSGRTSPDAIDARMGQGSVTMENLYADTRDLPGSFLMYARPYDRPGYDPSINYTPPWNDPAEWAKIGDHVLTIDGGTVITTGSRVINLRQRGPATVDSLEIVTDTAELATPASRADLFTVTALTTRSLSDTTTTPGPVDPPTEPVEPCDCSDEIADLQMQVQTLQAQVETLETKVARLTSENASLESENASLESENAALRTANDALRSTLARVQAERDEARAAFVASQARAQAAIEVLTDG